MPYVIDDVQQLKVTLVFLLFLSILAFQHKAHASPCVICKNPGCGFRDITPQTAPASLPHKKNKPEVIFTLLFISTENVKKKKRFDAFASKLNFQLQQNPLFISGSQIDLSHSTNLLPKSDHSLRPFQSMTSNSSLPSGNVFNAKELEFNTVPASFRYFPALNMTPFELIAQAIKDIESQRQLFLYDSAMYMAPDLFNDHLSGEDEWLECIDTLLRNQLRCQLVSAEAFGAVEHWKAHHFKPSQLFSMRMNMFMPRAVMTDYLRIIDTKVEGETLYQAQWAICHTSLEYKQLIFPAYLHPSNTVPCYQLKAICQEALDHMVYQAEMIQVIQDGKGKVNQFSPAENRVTYHDLIRYCRLMALHLEPMLRLSCAMGYRPLADTAQLATLAALFVLYDLIESEPL
ncbi:hypothetical protein ACWJJH_14935 [Endozoicomonadaceae bacterium StTr2]